MMKIAVTLCALAYSLAAFADIDSCDARIACVSQARDAELACSTSAAQPGPVCQQDLQTAVQECQAEFPCGQ